MVKPDTKAFGDALNVGILVSPNTRLAQGLCRNGVWDEKEIAD